MIKIPYGDEVLLFDAPDRRVKAILCAGGCSGQGAEAPGVQGEGTPNACTSDAAGADALDAPEENNAQETIVLNALAHPVGSPPLHELAKGKRKVTIITSDHTRPMPSKATMPLLLEEIRKGSPDADILILVATGLHRATTADELKERFGEEICQNEKIIVHDCRDESILRNIGTLPSGGSLVLSRYALDADLLISEGFIEPHFFAGFSGGRKSVLPGVAGYECVVSNHSSAFIANKNAAAGILIENPIHIDMAYAAKKAGLAFILNVLLDERQEIDDAVAGEPEKAHADGCERLLKKVAVGRATAPIVVTSNGGYPLDQNLYQLVKCMDAAEKCCEEGGVIIAVGECRDGVGGDAFYNDFAGGDSPQALLKRFLSRSATETGTDQWQSQVLARILEKRSVIVVAPLIEDAVKGMRLGWAANLDDALVQADAILGRPEGEEAEIIVIPNGPGVVVV